jgi:hypothetical protein
MAQAIQNAPLPSTSAGSARRPSRSRSGSPSNPNSFRGNPSSRSRTSSSSSNSNQNKKQNQTSKARKAWSDMVLPNNVPVLNKETGLYHCNDCPERKFRSVQTFRNHRSTIHGKLQTTFKCNKCGTAVFYRNREEHANSNNCKYYESDDEIDLHNRFAPWEKRSTWKKHKQEIDEGVKLDRETWKKQIKEKKKNKNKKK